MAYLLEEFPSPQSLREIFFSRTSPKAEMVLLGVYKKFKTTSQFSGFRLSNINLLLRALHGPPTNQPTTQPPLSLTLMSADSSPLAMATLVKSSDLPTLSIRLIMQGKVTEILVTPPTTFHPLASQPQPPNPTLDIGLCLVKPEVCCQLVPDNNKHPFDHFQLFSMSFMFRRYSLAVALCVFQTRDCTTCIDVQSCVRYKFTFWSPTRDNMADTFPPITFQL